VNRGIVAFNVIVFIGQLLLGAGAEGVIHTFGYMPARLLHPAAFAYSPWEVALTLVTSLFLHGGFVHLIGNMIYLSVFGGAVEDAIGHIPYLFFYGCLSLAAARGTTEVAGVAWWAHVGGFLFGAVAALAFRRARRKRTMRAA